MVNIFSNYVPKAFVIIDAKDSTLMAERIKNKIIKKATFISYTFPMAILRLISKKLDIKNKILQMIPNRKKECDDQLFKKNLLILLLVIKHCGSCYRHFIVAQRSL